MVVAFNTVGAVSINRIHEILGSVFNIPLSTGTIKNMVTRYAGTLKPAYEKIHQVMVNLGFIHCDEIGTCIDGKTWWVHNASDMDFTYLTIDRKRGRIGMDAAGILPDFHEIVVHDCWGPTGSIRMLCTLYAAPIFCGNSTEWKKTTRSRRGQQSSKSFFLP